MMPVVGAQDEQDESISLRILGPVTASSAGRAISLGGPKQRAVLAALATSLGRVISAPQLVDAIWDDDATSRSEHTLQVYISNLRKLLQQDGTGGETARALATQAPGYVLRAERVDLDLDRFRDRRGRGRALLDNGAAQPAVNAFEEALAQWHGPAFADVRGTRWFDAQATRLDEERIATEEDLCDAMLAAGRGRELIGRLEDLTREYPFRERLRGQLMIALYRTGRQADALAVFRETRDALIEELGIEPGDELRALEQSILMQDATLAAPISARADADAEVEDVLATIDTRGLKSNNAFLVLPDGQRVALSGGHTLIGRAPEATLRLTDHRVSRRHALVHADGEVYLLADLGSTNGTTINDQAFDGERALVAGDVISLGGVELRVEL